MTWTRGQWSGGLAEWTEGEVAYLSIAFTWRIPDAFSRAIFYRALGYRVLAGGPAVWVRWKYTDFDGYVSGIRTGRGATDDPAQIGLELAE